MKYVWLVAVSFVLAAAVGCRTAHMPITAELGQADRLAVQGRQGWKINETITFGPFQAVDIDRSWVRGGDFEFKAYEANSRRQQFSFVMSDNGREQLGASCEVNLGAQTIRTDVVDVELRNRSDVFCSLYPSGMAARDWVMNLQEKGDNPLKGFLEVDDRTYEVMGTNKLQGGLPAETTSGYTIRTQGRVVAAVEVIGDGAVVLAAGLDEEERALLTATAAALLVVEDLRAHLPSDME